MKVPSKKSGKIVSCPGCDKQIRPIQSSVESEIFEVVADADHQDGVYGAYPVLPNLDPAVVRTAVHARPAGSGQSSYRGMQPPAEAGWKVAGLVAVFVFLIGGGVVTAIVLLTLQSQPRLAQESEQPVLPDYDQDEMESTSSSVAPQVQRRETRQADRQVDLPSQAAPQQEYVESANVRVNKTSLNRLPSSVDEENVRFSMLNRFPPDPQRVIFLNIAKIRDSGQYDVSGYYKTIMDSLNNVAGIAYDDVDLITFASYRRNPKDEQRGNPYLILVKLNEPVRSEAILSREIVTFSSRQFHRLSLHLSACVIDDKTLALGTHYLVTPAAQNDSATHPAFTWYDFRKCLALESPLQRIEKDSTVEFLSVFDGKKLIRASYRVSPELADLDARKSLAYKQLVFGETTPSEYVKIEQAYFAAQRKLGIDVRVWEDSYLLGLAQQKYGNRELQKQFLSPDETDDWSDGNIVLSDVFLIGSNKSGSTNFRTFQFTVQTHLNGIPRLGL